MKTKSKPRSPKYEYVDFNVQREDWNEYKLQPDETIIKTKVILTNVVAEKGFKRKLARAKMKKGKGKGIKLLFSFTRAISIRTPPSSMSSPDKGRYSIEELKASVVKDNIDFETIKETWNIYSLADRIQLKIRDSPIHIGLTSKFDSVGIPIYVVDFSGDIVISPMEKASSRIESE